MNAGIAVWLIKKRGACDVARIKAGFLGVFSGGGIKTSTEKAAIRRLRIETDFS